MGKPPEYSTEHINKAIHIQNEHRGTWKEHDTAENLDQAILQETEELREAVEYALIGASAFLVASELGDVFYLYLRRLMISEAEIATNILEALRFAEDIAQNAGLSIEDCIRMKILRNDMKYLHGLTHNGWSYAEGKKRSKKQWEHMGGDQQFSKMYEELAEEL